MPEAEVFAGVKGPRIGSSPALGGQRNQRAWTSGVRVDERYGSAGPRERLST